MMDCKDVLVSRHAIVRMFERGISVNDVLITVHEGEVIIEYADDTPYPSFLLLGSADDRPLHVLASRNETSGTCIIITCYISDSDIWSEDFKTRKQT